MGFNHTVPNDIQKVLLNLEMGKMAVVRHSSNSRHREIKQYDLGGENHQIILVDLDSGPDTILSGNYQYKLPDCLELRHRS